MMIQPDAGDSDRISSRRCLCWIPIVHTQEDMGRLKGSVENLFVRRFGKTRWEAHRRTVTDLWRDIRVSVENAPLDFHNVRLYQDGLPVCGHEEKIVRELAGQGSANHLLLVDLMDRGAALTGTESPQLLIEEYELNRRILTTQLHQRRPPDRVDLIEQQAKALLEKRDQFIASRIDQTLREGEHGLLFLGLLHSIDHKLPTTIELHVQKPGDPIEVFGGSSC